LGLSIYEKECLAILFAVDHWRSYLQHGEFIIKTNQQSIIHLDDQGLSTRWQQKALTKLLGLKYKIIYHQGTNNRVADALSRRPGLELDAPHLQLNLVAISTMVPSWLQQVVHGYEQDPSAQKLLQVLATRTDRGQYTLTNGVIKYKGRISLGSNIVLQQTVMTTLHNSALGGHSGFPVTYRRLKATFT
jgi:hypothetical protein